MKILAINGSPRGNAGMTWWVLEKLVRGMEGAGAMVEVINLAGKKIHHCTGEFSCWFKKPGECIQKDDMEEILASFRDSDGIVIATPVYVDGMTGLMKNCIDRMLPLADSHIVIKGDHCRHESKVKEYFFLALASVCGFTELDNFDPLITHVRAFCKNMNVPYAGAVLRPAAPGIPAAKWAHPFKLKRISKAIETAGSELVMNGRVSDATAQTASEDIFSREDYIKHTNKYFDDALKKVTPKVPEQQLGA